jgi:hypothetical protein
LLAFVNDEKKVKTSKRKLKTKPCNSKKKEEEKTKPCNPKAIEPRTKLSKPQNQRQLN